MGFEPILYHEVLIELKTYYKMIVDIQTKSGSPPNQEQPLTNIYFKVLREVKFGCGIYVAGNHPSLGSWDISRAKKLNHGEDGAWRGTVALELTNVLEYKYIIADFQNPHLHQIVWENGENRVIIPQKVTEKDVFLDEKWNSQRIKFQLSVFNLPQNSEIYIVGNCIQLGLFLSPITLPKASKHKQSGEIVFSQILNVEKSQPCIKYCYIYRTPNSILRSKMMSLSLGGEKKGKERYLEQDWENYPGYILIKNSDRHLKLLIRIDHGKGQKVDEKQGVEEERHQGSMIGGSENLEPTTVLSMEGKVN